MKCNKGMVGLQDIGSVILLGLVVMGALVGAGLVLWHYGVFTPGGGSGATNYGTGNLNIGAPMVIKAQECGDDGMGTINFRIKNDLNTSSAEWYVVTTYLYKQAGTGYEYVGSKDTNDTGLYATYTNVPCGVKYALYVLSADGAAGDNNYVNKLDSPDSTSAPVTVDKGVVYIDMSEENAYVTMHSTQHATLEFRAKDLVEDGMMYDTSDSSATDWETTGVVFTSMTNNATNMTISANGGTFKVQLQVRAIQSDTQYAADGLGSVLVLVNADTDTWPSDSIKIDEAQNIGKAVSQFGLTKAEADKWSAQEYAFQSSALIQNDPWTTYTISGKTKDGVSTWKCPVITFASRGNYLGTTNGDVMLHSAARDDSSQTSVYSTQSVTLRTGACSASS